MKRPVTASLIALFLTVSFASAATISVSSPPGNEAGHLEILNAIYGGGFSANGVDFVSGGENGAISAVRQADSTSSMTTLELLDTARDEAGDAVWTGGAFEAKAVARYAGHSQRFGLDRGNGFELLFDLTGSGTNVAGSAAIDLGGDSWRWVRRKQDNTNTFYSDPAWNSDGLDHMVTYRITGLDEPGATWLLFWEDLPASGSDLDYNDLVVEVRAIPEPATLAWTAIGGLLTVAAWRRRLAR